jgi:hypothetical protein
LYCYDDFIIYLSAHNFGGFSLDSPIRKDEMRSGTNGSNSSLGGVVPLVPQIEMEGLEVRQWESKFIIPLEVKIPKKHAFVKHGL